MKTLSTCQTRMHTGIFHATADGKLTLCGFRVGEMHWERPRTPIEIDCKNCQRIAQRQLENEPSKP